MSQDAPIFSKVFGDQWCLLPPIMHKHYANRPFCDEEHVAVGEMDIRCARPLAWLATIFKFVGGIPALNANKVEVRVRFRSSKNTRSLHFVREFFYKGESPHIFHSHMTHRQHGSVSEVTKFGLVWRSHFTWNGVAVLLAHEGYAFSLLGYELPVPLTWLLGSVHAEEHPIDEECFRMKMEVRHPLWGFVYGYRGQFRMQ